jgi:hypothetical protein
MTSILCTLAHAQFDVFFVLLHMYNLIYSAYESYGSSLAVADEETGLLWHKLTVKCY